MEEWFEIFPQEGCSEIEARIKSCDDANFKSAFFELYLNALLIGLGYSMEVHPEANTQVSTRPDFLVKYQDEPAFFLEAVVATETSREERGRAAIKDRVLDDIDSLESPNFFLHVKHSGEPSTAPSTKKLKKELSDWLSTLDSQDCFRLLRESGLRALPSFMFRHEAWTVEFRAFPKSDRLRGKPRVKTIGMESAGLKYVDTAGAVRKVLKRKISRYGKLGLPFIVAVNAMQVHSDEIAILEALLGTETFVGDLESESMELARASDGIWSVAGRNTRVSAVLVVKALHSTTAAVADTRLYHNPSAALSCSGRITELPQATIGEKGLQTRPGVAAKDLLGIDLDWLERTV
ncbi:MAG: hypothetical protein WAM82_17835 [Thermoanaerobaculia bacterium]